MSGSVQGGGILGQRITGLRKMTKSEMRAEGWEHEARWSTPVCIVLEDGTLLYPSRDGEGNGPGVLFGRAKDGTSFLLSA